MILERQAKSISFLVKNRRIVVMEGKNPPSYRARA
jgi:hypothetical protein